MAPTSAAIPERGYLEAAVDLESGVLRAFSVGGVDARGTQAVHRALPLYCLIKPILGLALLCDPDWERLIFSTGKVAGRTVSVLGLLTHRAGLNGAQRWSSAFLPLGQRLATVRTTATFDEDAIGDPTGHAYSDLDAWILADGILNGGGRSLWGLLDVNGLADGLITPHGAGPSTVSVDWIEAGAYRFPLEFLASRAWRRDPLVFLNAYLSDGPRLLRGIAKAFNACRESGDDRLDAFTNSGRFHQVGFDYSEQSGPREYGVGTMSDGGIHHPELRGLIGHYTWRGTSGLFIDTANSLALISIRLGVESALGPQPSLTVPRHARPEPVDALARRVSDLRNAAQGASR